MGGVAPLPASIPDGTAVESSEGYSLAAIDDVIARGRWADWADLGQAVRADMPLLERVERLCHAHLREPYAQRHHFWMHDVQVQR